MSAQAAAAITVGPSLETITRLFREGWCGCVSQAGAHRRHVRVRSAEDRLDFALPPEIAATAPPEARGLARDGVRMLVTRGAHAPVTHTCVRALDRFLEPGDVLVVNTSRTLKAALPAWPHGTSTARRAPFRLHLSQALPDGRWSVELRQVVAGNATEPALDRRASERFDLEGGASVTLAAPLEPEAPRRRLWIASIDLPGALDLLAYLDAHGEPVRYGYVTAPWPEAAYQTPFALEAGSAEMPSAGRPLTSRVFQRLRERGVGIAPVVLHTGLASPEDDEPPYAERYRVPRETAALVSRTRASGRRVIAVGTTVVRALESVADDDGHVRPGEGWTDLVITRERGVRVVDGLLTGFHEPRASHLWMLSAIAGRAHLATAYEEALRHRYLWHEFGDVHLVLPPRRGAARSRRHQ